MTLSRQIRGKNLDSIKTLNYQITEDEKNHIRATPGFTYAA
jgi:hypothetical protein